MNGSTEVSIWGFPDYGRYNRDLYLLLQKTLWENMEKEGNIFFQLLVVERK